MMNTQAQITHLFGRAGFGLSPREYTYWKDRSRQEALDELFRRARSTKSLAQNFTSQAEGDRSELSKNQKKQRRKREKRLVILQNTAWLARMANPQESALLEKMTLFWHGHFACIIRNSKLAYQYLQTIRTHALGSFREMVHAIAKEPAMIRFLNNQQNKKSSPNENFARELLELFTIGRGNYSEQDIKEAARAFTGWSSNLRGNFQFRRRQHDFGEKIFMGKKGHFNGEEVIDIILAQPETATFITRKIYRYFVNDKVDEERLQQLARQFYQSDYDIEDLMYTIFSSDWFYDPSQIGVRIKSPVELLAGIMRSLEVEFEKSLTLIFVQKGLGQVLFNPPNVAGWAGGKSWIDNSTLMLRLNLVAYLFQAVEVNFKAKEEFESRERNKAIRKIKAKVNLKPLVRELQAHDNDSTLEAMIDYLLPSNVQINRGLIREFTLQEDPQDFIKTLALRLMSMPEYQLC